MLIMESLLGLINTKETGKEVVHVIDTKVGVACQELFTKINKKNIKKPPHRGGRHQPSIRNR